MVLFCCLKGGEITITKTKRIRLHGAALRALNDAIFERDDYKCVICGAYVSSDHKFHHEPQGASKSDEVDKGVVLCDVCHYKRHFTAMVNELKTEIQLYLQQYYNKDD